jgi:bifunctional non-homologous end joining protein LigD
LAVLPASSSRGLPTNGHIVPTGPEWAYEIKHDGFRFICRRELDRVRVFSRRGHDWTDRVPRIAEPLGSLQVTSIIIDGEGVVCGPDGVADFDRLRAAVGWKGSRDAFLYVSIYSNLMGMTCAGSLGRFAATHWRAFYVTPSMTRISTLG